MALMKCHECGGSVSSQASVCPHCGAPTKRREPTTLRWLVSLLVAIILTGGYLMRPQGPSVKQGEQGHASVEPAKVDFSQPLQTQNFALVCPQSVAFDNRVGHGLQAAMKAHSSVFGHQEEVANVGCEEWRAGQRVELDSDAIKQATEWQAQDRCGMLRFGQRFILSCSLENIPRQAITSLAAPAVAASKSVRTNWDACLKYQPMEVTLTGTLKRVVFPGPPNFESVEQGDSPEPRLVLVLDAPVCVMRSTVDILDEAEDGVSDIQTGGFRDMDAAPVGRRVRISGTLTHSFNGHHHTRVMLNATNWSALPD